MRELLLFPCNVNGLFFPDLTFYFLESAKQNIGGWDAGYIYVDYVDLITKDISAILNEDITVSSTAPGHSTENIKRLDGGYWVPAYENNGNPNGDCWLRINNINSYLSSVRIYFAQGGSCRYVRISSTNGWESIIDVRNKPSNFYPIVGSNSLCEIELF